MKPSKTLIQKAIDTFSPYQETTVTESEAEEIIANCLNLLEVLGIEAQRCGEQNENKMPFPACT